MSLIIYIAEKLFRTAHADVFLLEHHQKVCVSTICGKKHVLKIFLCAEKKNKIKKPICCKGFLSFLGVMELNIRTFLLLFIYLFPEWTSVKGSA